MTYALVMIVRDEADVIEKTLLAAKPHLAYWTIVDTGSTDGTQDIIRRVMEGVPGQLVERPWVNFGHNRSEAFALAKGTADWLLALDADMAVEIDADFEPDPKVEGYLLQMSNGAIEWRLMLILRGDLDWQSNGAVHEYTTKAGKVLAITAQTDKVRVPFVERSSAEKTAMQTRLLEEELEREPDNERTVFYLAQCYRDGGQREKAREMYLRRVAMGKWDQEVFYARYQAAQLVDWPQMADELMSCWESRPQRIEPLVTLIAELNRRDDHRTAYQLCQVIPLVHTDTLFVHREAWDYVLKFEKSIAAWWVGHKLESKQLSEELLKNPRLSQPIREAVERNLAVC